MLALALLVPGCSAGATNGRYSWRLEGGGPRGTVALVGGGSQEVSGRKPGGREYLGEGE